jgi:hypothetical protein
MAVSVPRPPLSAARSAAGGRSPPLGPRSGQGGVNQWIDERILPISGFKLTKVARIQMSQRLADRLDLASKVDRSPGYLHELMAEGERQAGAFLRDRQDPGARWWEPMFPHRYRERQESQIARRAVEGGRRHHALAVRQWRSGGLDVVGEPSVQRG